MLTTMSSSSLCSPSLSLSATPLHHEQLLLESAGIVLDHGALHTTTTTNNNNNTNKHSRTVKFEPTVSTKTIQSARQLSDEEFRSIWYTEEELFKIKLHATETVLVMMANSDEFPPVDDENSDEYCSRGLRTKEEFSKRRLAIFDSVDAVLEEQYAQQDVGIHDDELLADIYFQLTWNSQDEAVDRAEAHTRANKDLRTV
jgi:hypothetical protein